MRRAFHRGLWRYAALLSAALAATAPCAAGGIPARTLLESSFVPATAVLWRQHDWYLVGALGVILAQALTIVAMLVQRARRRTAEATLQENRRFMDLATTAGEMGLWVLDVPGGSLWASPRLRSLVGVRGDGTIRMDDVIARVHPDDRPRIESVLRRAVQEGHAFSLEGRLLLPDGTERWVSAKGMAVRDGRGRPIRMEGVILDLTERHEAELAAERHRNELVHIGRVNMLGQLSSAMAHELNQPLGAILNNIEAAELFLDQSPPALSELRAILGDIRRDDQRASDVIHRMRSLLRRHEIKVAPVSIRELIDDCLSLIWRDAIERRITVERQIRGTALQIRGDRAHLQQVLLNLLLNGMEAMKDSPEIARKLLVTVGPGGDHDVEFAVADTGLGIRPDHLDRLFEPFFSTKHDGLGLGLSISRTIIEAHHGRIWAENNPGGGATVRFTLPAVEEGRATEREARG